MEKFVYTASMGIQPTAFIRKVHIRYSFPKEQLSTGGKDDGAGELGGYPDRATPALGSPSEQNTLVNRVNSLRIRVHCNMTGSRPLHSLLQAESPAQADESAKEQCILPLPSCNSKQRALY